jgi:MerR family transcriptional regulator/heat shock protein HspR
MADDTGPRVDRPLFMISMAAELAAMHPQTLRLYERRGLLAPRRSAKNTRLYSLDDVARLRRIQALTELGLNLAGVERVLELEREMTAMRERVERLQAELVETVARMHIEMRAVERSFRRDLVPVSKTTAVIHFDRRKKR